MNVKDLVGKRALLKIDLGSYNRNDVQEYRILEMSPSGNWVKFMDINGRRYWKLVSSIGFVEELQPLERPPPALEKQP